MASNLIYSLDTINEIKFNGFNYKLSDETLRVISEIALQVGSPDYVKTPIFKKREIIIKTEPKLKKNKGKYPEIISDDEWNNVKQKQTLLNNEKNVFDTQIDIIRVFLNKLTDKNYIDIRNKIIEVIDSIIEDTNIQNIIQLSTIIFEIASTNRFYSKIYADLYTDLSVKYTIMMTTFEVNLHQFTELFNNIEYIEPNVNYDKFCEINKINEKRKSLAAFYINLMLNNIIKKQTIIDITRNLLSQLYNFISLDNKKNEVDELCETIFILYKKDLYIENNENEIYYKNIEGYNINEIIKIIASSKVKDYKSLTNKTLFKFMDLKDML
jgi:Fe-S cluster biosynthesis and repair protein YggX